MTQWLVCKVLPGMLPEELAVVIQTEKGELSLFLSKGQIRIESGSVASYDAVGRIPVSVLDQNDRYSLITLPAEAIEGPRVATVDRHHLTAA